MGRHAKAATGANLYPLMFQPLFQYRPWGGRRLGEMFDWQLPGDNPIGEAWILSDRDDHASLVRNGPLQGRSMAALLDRYADEMLGTQAGKFRRFPLLLKFLDVRKTLSVQVHPSDERSDLLPPGEMGKTEGWVVLEAERRCRIYAGVKRGVTAGELRSLSRDTVDERLTSFHPHPGDCVLIEAGTVHALGGGTVVFEVQENSDVTFRLYDWDNIDPASGRRRPLQIDEALACIDYGQGDIEPLEPQLERDAPVKRERALDCSHFLLWKIAADAPFDVGEADECRILVCIAGEGTLRHGAAGYPCHAGDVVFLPASLDACRFKPAGHAEILEISIPEAA